MGKLTDLIAWNRTSLVDLFKEAESSSGNKFDLVEIGLKNGRTVAIAVISGPHTEAITEAMRKLNKQDEYEEKPWKRDEYRTYCVLLLVSGYNVSQEAVASWSDEECKLAEEWAGAKHLKASDNNDVVVPKIPVCVIPFLTR